MKSITPILAALTLPFVLTGCLNSDSDPLPEPPEPPAFSNLRVTHAVSDAPTVNVIANGDTLSEGADYQASTGWQSVLSDTYTVEVNANLPGGDSATVIGPVDLTLTGDMNYDVVAVGQVGDIEPLVLENAETTVTSGNARVQILHAAANAPMVDIYVTAPDAELASEQALATLSFKEYTAQTEVAGGDYRVRITPAGADTVVFDSGTINLADGADLMVAATDNTGAGDSPVTLLAVDANGATRLWDTNTGANLRVLHGSPDAPAVDVLVNNATMPMHYQLDGLAYPNATDYLAVPADELLVDVVADADNSVVAIDDAAVAPMQGMAYTAIATNTLADIQLALLTDDHRSIATAAKVRLIHNAPAAGDVDIYVTADDDISDDDPAFTDVPYDATNLATTGYVELAEGTYYITITPADTKTEAIGPLMVELNNGDVLSAVALEANGGGTPLQAVILDDSKPAPVSLDATQTFEVSLDGMQEVPAVDTAATAAATVLLDEDDRLFSVTVDTSAVDNVTGVHVHDGNIGRNGPVAFPLQASGDDTYTLPATNLLDPMIEALKSGEWYINVHTEANPSGEVRGQIVPETMAVVTFPLSGSQEVPSVTTDAMGYGYATLDTTTLAVDLVAVTMGVEDATMAHIHTGYAGENGPVYVTLEQSMDDANVWMTPAGAMIDATNAARLVEGGHYVNIHTPANPSGELRGQITPDNIEVYGVTATGDQEVPAVDTNAMGEGAITLNTSTMTIKAIINVMDISPNAAHIHQGAVGENGGVVIGLTNPDAGLWTLDATLTEAQMALMQAEGLYTNFHTDAFPSGEIRGQITLGFE
ncbi:hypothetical protein HMF8227_01122 [Saliniradius amylolyticus]|uniref:CHRD domain-containing protein n=1 Tax=Saliniradius amylolyticus TaxID=2183582 RepID=A0A2S2E1T5_9ALTE|nr:CHRD domain-containing protein [Saliniradius amylolyticus]AWL11603.1 hypothetical protein HMF8227_01122 [Saliniradius amylolyticus]